ncbi:hypothetical protein K7432_014954 [Basidiobolus ranarum]|uniref:Uncharacterized protein n=1 Tax=Basidiobolus ranarum TaxID=34480 RepID=A0ABR2WGY2_9FUNG
MAILLTLSYLLIFIIHESNAIGYVDILPQPTADSDSSTGGNKSRISSAIVVGYILGAVVVLLLIIYGVKKLIFYQATRELRRRVQLARRNQIPNGSSAVDTSQDSLPKYAINGSQLILPISTVEALTSHSNEYQLESVTSHTNVCRDSNLQTHCASPLPIYSPL